MGIKIANLLKWRTEVKLHFEDGRPITTAYLGDAETEKEGTPVSVWLRILGDEDLEDAFQKARVKSATVRKALRTEGSKDFIEIIEPIKEASKEECIDTLKISRTANLYNEAIANVERKELPKLDEFAIDPEAPSLEEQEKLDAAIREQEAEYEKEINEYQVQRTAVILAELEPMTVEELRDLTTREASVYGALSAFIQELEDQKLWRAAYTDKACRERAFENIDEWRATDLVIRSQLIQEYDKLELKPQDIKNSQKEILGE